MSYRIAAAPPPFSDLHDVASAWQRVGGFVIDVIVCLVTQRVAQGTPVADDGVFLVLGVYRFAFHWFCGRTPGKFVVGTEVIGLDERRSWRRAGRLAARESVFLVPGALNVVAGAAMFLLDLEVSDTGFAHIILLLLMGLELAFAVLLADLVTMLASPERRSLHDHLGGTFVRTV